MSLSAEDAPPPWRSSPPPWRNSHLVLGGGRDPPLSDQGETIIGVYLLLLGWLSWFGNSIVLFVLLRQRSSLQPSDFLTFNLAVSDASISVFGYSRGIIEIFNVFQDSDYLISSIWTCQVDGFFTLLFGLSSINTLTVISITRYVKGCLPHRAHHISLGSVCVALVLIWITAAFWAGAPLLGWGRYKDRGYGTCEIDWSRASYSLSSRSYIVSLLVSCFFLPVLLMLFCYVSIINTVKRGNAMTGAGLSDRQRHIERDVTIVSIVICTAFILAWSPYAVVSVCSASGLLVPDLTSIFTRLFAKSASFYNPLIYFGLSSQFRRDVKALLPCVRRGGGGARLRGEGGARMRGGGRARLRRFKPPPRRKYSPPTPEPPCTPPPANQEVFFIDMPLPSEADSEFECDRL